MSPDVMVALATFALVLITGVAGLLSLRGLREQLWLVTFSEYTRRYSEIMDALPFEVRRPGGQFDVEAMPVDERDRALGAMRKYLNLCSEGLYLHNRGKIDGETNEMTVKNYVELGWQFANTEDEDTKAAKRLWCITG